MIFDEKLFQMHVEIIQFMQKQMSVDEYTYVHVRFSQDFLCVCRDGEAIEKYVGTIS